MNPQYEILAKCLLPTHMLEWFELTNVEVKPKEKTATQDTESDESPVNVIHLYLDENEFLYLLPFCNQSSVAPVFRQI
jgi:hypothetical protein